LSNSCISLVLGGHYLAPHIPGGLCQSPGDFLESTWSPVASFFGWEHIQIGMHNQGLYSPPGIPPRIQLESQNSAGLIMEFDILVEAAWNIMGIGFLLLCLVILYRV